LLRGFVGEDDSLLNRCAADQFGREDRVAVDDLGDLETTPWQTGSS